MIMSAVVASASCVESDGETSCLFWMRNKRWKLYSDGRFYDMSSDSEEKTPVKEDSMSEEARTSWGELRRAVAAFEPGGE